MSDLLMSSEIDTQFVPVGDPPRRLPGVEGVWVFVIADMTVFAVLFGSFIVGRHQNPGLFEASRHALDPNFGGVNTLIVVARPPLSSDAGRAPGTDGRPLPSAHD